MKKKDMKNDFSVALGLTDYVNPLMYLITSTVITMNIGKIMTMPWSLFYIIGVIISLIFGFTIPTVKLMVGLGRMKFSLPVNLVFYVNSGIFLSGLMLLKSFMNIQAIVMLFIMVASFIILYMIYRKTKKFNNVAVLIGAIGYLLIYISLITKSIGVGIVTPVIFYCIAICLYLLLIFIGIKANLKDARVHWVIEISNILCQTSVAIGTIILFANLL